MKNILILATDTQAKSAGRRGDLFDAALLEIVRTLDVSSDIASVLVPWSDELAPLIAVAVADTAPSFDPERAGKEGSQSGLILYRLSSFSSDERSRPFRDGSHLSLTERLPITLSQAVDKYPPTDVIVLSLPKDIPSLQGSDIRFFVFGSLLALSDVRATLAIPAERMEDLELKLSPIEDKLSTARPEEEGLEPYIPFGLLIQDVFREILPDEPPSRSLRGRR
jgi:hypothetical protein